MKILTVLSTFPPHYYGGGEISAMSLSKWLVQQGHEVGVVTAAEASEPELHGVLMDGMRVWRLRFPRPYTFWNHAKSSKWLKPLWYLQDHFDPRNRKLMRKVLEDFRPECVQVHVVAGIGYNSFLEIGKRKTPTIYFMHDLSLACLWGGMFKNGKVCETQCTKCRVVSKIRFSCVTSIPFLAFCSPSHANLNKASEILPLKAYKTAVIFNPNKYPLPTVTKTESKILRFLYVGRLTTSKGVDLLLNALKNLSNEYNFTINLLGEGAESTALRNKFSNFGWCHFNGHVTQEEVSNWMTKCDVLCAPSIWPENLPGVIIQALELGLPVLGSNIGGIPELIHNKKNGLLVPPDDQNAWEIAIRSLLDNPTQLTAWSEYAKNDAERFNQDKNGNKILELFKEVIELSRK